MNKIWVVEMQCNKGKWWTATKEANVLAYNNYYSAHKARRLHYRYLKSVAPRIWSWKRIRVRQWNAPQNNIVAGFTSGNRQSAASKQRTFAVTLFAIGNENDL